MTELKPCPFCGGFASVINVEFNDGDVWYRPECSECKCGWQENYESIGEAVNVWNLRAEGRRMTEQEVAMAEDIMSFAERNAYFHLTSKEFKALQNNVSEALQKQIPMKPKKIEEDNYGEKITYSICPICETTLLNKYCDNCGQLLDWRDKE